MMSLTTLLLITVSANPDFSRDIRPILADKCFACHGPDAEQRKAGLRLDVADRAVDLLVSGERAIVPGDTANSELVRRILSQDPDLVMPPEETKKPLTAEEKTLLKEWVAAGAKFNQHWAFVAPKRPAIPAVKTVDWVQNEIDAFVLAGLEEAQMRPSAVADRITLIRRLSLDLRGLPPTVAEVDAFLHDQSPHAYERLVDGLLASEHFGERMAQGWLDLARFGDTNGYHADSDRTMWLYRDYVINAFNENKPYSQFMLENVAGDLMPDVTDETRIASGFNRCNTFNEEGGADPDEFYVAYAVDRANTIGQVFLGLTVGCAQCHDHKYDPITQKDYYQLFAFFNSVKGEVGAGGPGGYHGKELPPLLPVATQEQRDILDAFPEQTKALEMQIEVELARFDQPLEEFDAALQQWIKEIRGDATQARPDLEGITLWLDAADVNGNGVDDRTEEIKPEPKLAVWRDRSGNGYDADALAAPDYVPAGLAGLPAVRFDGVGQHMRTQAGGGELGDEFTMVVVFQSILEENNQMLVMWGEETTGKRRSIWRTGDGKFAFNGHGRDVVGSKTLSTQPHIGVITYDAAGEIRLFVDGAEAGSGKPDLKPFANQRITIGCNNSNGEFAGAEFSEVLLWGRRLSEAEHQQLGKFFAEKYSLTSEYGGAPKDISEIVALPDDVRTAEQENKLRRYFARHVYPSSLEIFNKIDAELAELSGLERKTREAIPTTLVMVEKQDRTPAYVLVRGDFRHQAEAVQPDVPAIFPRLPEGYPRTRLALAHWLSDPKNPLVARVAVNRFWKHLFGAGLVKTLGDFGTQGAPPSHPELLDWLTVEFVENGWDVKKLLKTMVLSATFRQLSVNFHAYDESDPYNRMLSRAPRFRLSAEAVRDSALAVSGLLNPQIGGPSVRPYQPKDYYADKIGRSYDQSTGENLYRRGLYTYWRRTTLYPTFQIFDAPSREVCTVNRPRTNTPLQALVLMNDPTFVEAGRVFGQRILIEGGETDREKLIFAFRTAVSRFPTQAEATVLQEILEEQRAIFRLDLAAAEELVKNGESLPWEGADPAELAAWTSLGSVLLNLDEAITRE